MTTIVPPATDLRDCKLYRFYGWDPRTGYTTKTLIYIGETVRMPFDRLMEHVARQPWADTITGWEVVDAVFAGKDAVVAAEQKAVERDMPLYNWEWNSGNPDRIGPDDQKVQRWARDDAAVPPRPRWQKKTPPTVYRQGVEVPAPQNPPVRPYGKVAAAAPKPKPAAAKRGKQAKRGKRRAWLRELISFAIVWPALSSAVWVLEYYIAWDADWWRIPLLLTPAAYLGVRLWIVWRFWPLPWLWGWALRKLGVR